MNVGSVRQWLGRLVATALLFAVGCSEPMDRAPNPDRNDDRAPASQRDDSFLDGGKSDQLHDVQEGSPEADALLKLVNTAGFETLDDEVSLDVRAAQNIVDARSDGDIATLEELDGIDWVGSRAFRKLVAYAEKNGLFDDLGPDAVHGIEPGTTEAEAVLELARTGSFETLDDDVSLDVRAAWNIVDTREDSGIETLERLDDIAWVESRAFGKLYDYADANGMFRDPIHGVRPGSPVATDILELVDEASLWHLDTDVSLDIRAAKNIAKGRRDASIQGIDELDRISYVASRAFGKLLDYVRTSHTLRSAPSATQWVRLFGTGSTERVQGVATDEEGAIYVAGTVGNELEIPPPNTNDDAFLTKYDADGNRVWHREVGGDDRESGHDVAVSDSGDVYLVGSATSALQSTTYHGGREDGFVANFSKDGKRRWTTLIGSGDADDAYTVAAHPGGGVVVGGDTRGSFGGETNQGLSDAYVARYDSNGARRWIDFLGSTIHDTAADVAVHTDGDILVAGGIGGAVAGESFGGGTKDGFVSRYRSDGTRKWTRLVGDDGVDDFSGVAVDEDGTVVAVGTSDGPSNGASYEGGRSDVLAVKFSASGSLNWMRLFGTSGEDVARDVAFGPESQSYVVGHTDGTFGAEQRGGTDAFVLAVGADGSADWRRQFGSSDRDEIHGGAFGRSSGLVVGGRAGGAFGGQSYGGRARPDGFVVAWP